MMIVAKSTLPSYQARDIVDDQFAKRITQITGMASVDIKGGRVREIHLDADPSGLIAHNLSLRRLATLVRDSNLNSPRGTSPRQAKRLPSYSREPSSPKELGEIGIPFGGGSVTRLGNVVRVVDGLADLDTDWKVGRFELRITPDQYRLSSMGVTLSLVAEDLRGYLTGIEAGVFREKGYECDILVKLSDRWIESSSRVPYLPMWTPSGFVPVGELTDVITEPSPTAIYRVDRQRKVSVTADVAGRAVGEVFRDINPRMEEIDLPAGYRFLIKREMQNIQENFQRMLMAFGMAIILTFLMIAGILESYLFSFVIMLTITLSVIGVIPALLLTGTSLSIYGLLGLVMIVGLVVNNAIVVVDYAEVVRKKGHKAAEAVIEACRVRFRPIIMPDVTTLVAMLPLALGLGAGGQYRAPLAIVLIGGLLLAVPWRFS